jgi:hypothetical protein
MSRMQNRRRFQLFRCKFKLVLVYVYFGADQMKHVSVFGRR